MHPSFPSIFQRLTLLFLCVVLVTLTGCSGGQATTADGIPGGALLENAAMATGGLYALEEVRSVYREGTSTVFTSEGPRLVEVTESRVFPDRSQTIVRSSNVSGIETLDGNSGWISYDGDEPQRASGQQVKNWVNTLWHDPLFLLSRTRDPELKVLYQGRGVVGERPAEVLAVFPPNGGESFQLFLDASTMMPLRLTYLQKSTGSSAIVEFSDFENVDSLRLPKKITWYEAGKVVQETRYETITINAEFPDELFEMRLP